MAGKHHKPEEIVAKLRQVEVLAAQSKTVAEGARAIGVTEATYRDELLAAEVFNTLAEAEVLIEQWRKHYNTVRPHSALGYRPPAPEVALWPVRPTTRTMVPKPVMY